MTRERALKLIPDLVATRDHPNTGEAEKRSSAGILETIRKEYPDLGGMIDGKVSGGQAPPNPGGVSYNANDFADFMDRYAREAERRKARQGRGDAYDRARDHQGKRDEPEEAKAEPETEESAKRKARGFFDPEASVGFAEFLRQAVQYQGQELDVQGYARAHDLYQKAKAEGFGGDFTAFYSGRPPKLKTPKARVKRSVEVPASATYGRGNFRFEGGRWYQEETYPGEWDASGGKPPRDEDTMGPETKKGGERRSRPGVGYFAKRLELGKKDGLVARWGEAGWWFDPDAGWMALAHLSIEDLGQILKAITTEHHTVTTQSGYYPPGSAMHKRQVEKGRMLKAKMLEIQESMDAKKSAEDLAERATGKRFS